MHWGPFTDYVDKKTNINGQKMWIFVPVYNRKLVNAHS